jgi:hypothetical protein
MTDFEKLLIETLREIRDALEERTRIDNEAAQRHMELHQRADDQQREALDVQRKAVDMQRRLLEAAVKMVDGNEPEVRVETWVGDAATSGEVTP